MEEDSSSNGARNWIDELSVGTMGEVPHGSARSDDELTHRDEELDIPEEAKDEVEQAVLHAFIPVHRPERRIRVHNEFS